MVIMAADIAHMLKRTGCPALYGHLRMLNTTGDPELKVWLLARNSVHEACVLTSERTTYGIADIVAESTYPVEQMGIGLQGNLLCGVCRGHRCPTFSVQHDIRVDGVEALTDDVHGLDIMNGHEVEAEAVDMIFLHPPLE